MKKIKTIKDVKGIKFGDQYIIDIFPDDPEEFLKNEEALLKLDAEITAAVEKEVAVNMVKEAAQTQLDKNEEKTYTKSDINKMKEAELVELAKSLGIDASVKDLVKDTRKKIKTHLNL